jgi:IclR family acetate operon transcriptional repressor
LRKISVSDRVTAILKSVGLNLEGISMPGLIHETGIVKPTLHRLVGQLRQANYVAENSDGLIIPGAKFVQVAISSTQANLRRVQRESILTGMSKELGETCGISIPRDNHMVYYDRVEANWPLQVHIPLNVKTPFWATASGKLYLSTLSKSARLSLIGGMKFEKFAKNTITDYEQLEQEIKSIKQQGYSLDNEELIDGMVAIAVPILDKKGKYLASLFCHCPMIRKNIDELLHALPVIKRYSAELEVMLENLA